MIAACDVISGTASTAAAGARLAWIRLALLDPLAARLGRAGYDVEFDPDFVAWLDRQLPTDGSPPEDYLDREVTPRIVANLPTTPGPLSVGLVDDAPAVRPRSSTATEVGV